MFLMWLGEQITARGIGNGISLIIFAGIVAGLPHALIADRSSSAAPARSRPAAHHLRLAIGVAVIAFIVFMERAQRRILVQYPKRQAGNRMYGGESLASAAQAQHVGRDPADLRLLAAAACRRRSPASAGASEPGWLQRDRRRSRPRPPLYMLFYVGADRLLLLLLHRDRLQPERDRRQPEEARRLHPRHPAGQEDTADYLDYVLTRLTVVGALYLAAVCVLPEILISPLRRAVLLRRHQPADRRLASRWTPWRRSRRT